MDKETLAMLADETFIRVLEHPDFDALVSSDRKVLLLKLCSQSLQWLLDREVLMPAPTNYQCCEMCHRTGDQLSDLCDEAELKGMFKTKDGRAVPEWLEEKLRERFEIKWVLLDGNMETEMCGFCVGTIKRSGEMKVEVL